MTILEKNEMVPVLQKKVWSLESPRASTNTVYPTARGEQMDGMQWGSSVQWLQGTTAEE